MPPAARVLDATNHPGMIAGPGVANVLINGHPAARMGDLHACALPPLAGPHPPSPIAAGSATVFIAASRPRAWATRSAAARRSWSGLRTC